MPPEAAARISLSSVARAGMKCLWIARYIPYPLDAGAKVYSAKLAESLAASGVTVRFMGIGESAAIPAHCNESVSATRMAAVPAWRAKVIGKGNHFA